MKGMEFINIAAYKFVDIPDPDAWQPVLKARCQEIGVLGSILLAKEGINFFAAAERAAIDEFIHFIRNDDLFEGKFNDITVKESISTKHPYRRIIVKVKDEIIAMKHPVKSPAESRAPSVDPQTLTNWLDQGHDDNGREVVLLDTRNDYEVMVGTFEGAIDLGIEKFSNFPEAFRDTAADIKERLKDKTVVSFCTGGIRCEKAALFLTEENIPNVFQLDGGILRYFELQGNAHWRGECFVFDKRVAVDTSLKPTTQTYEFQAKTIFQGEVKETP